MRGNCLDVRIIIGYRVRELFRVRFFSSPKYSTEKILTPNFHHRFSEPDAEKTPNSMVIRRVKMLRSCNRLGGILIVVMMSFQTLSLAQRDTQCFLLEVMTFTDSLPAETKSHELTTQPETWCYLPLRLEGKDHQFIFSADSEDLRPHLSALVELKNGRIFKITHGSLNQGQITIHKSRWADINPLPVPLNVKQAEREGRESQVPLSRSLTLSVEKMIEEFAVSRETEVRWTVSEGTFESNLEKDAQPYDAYWWGYSALELGSGPYSPLGKYDSFVEKLTGTNPKSVDWEKENHSLTNVAWGGHCNGWAASALIYSEPTKYLWDRQNQKVIFPSDIEGLLSESSFCLDWAFYGTRYNKTGDDAKDIYPDKFHKVLIYYIDYLKKSVAFDRYYSAQVDNNVYSGYKFEITKVEGQEKKFHVVATIRAHDYNHSRNEKPGTSPAYSARYSYDLDVDDSGEIIGGTWLSGNPDFLWVPLAQKKCGRENPYVDQRHIDKMMSLPEAKKIIVPFSYSLDRALAPGEEVIIPIPETLKGSEFVIHVSENTLGPIYLGGMMHPAYPTRHWHTTDWHNRYLPVGANQDITLRGSDLQSLKIKNYSSTEPSVGTQFKIKSIEYLGGE
jgi:hypothetical protein